MDQQLFASWKKYVKNLEEVLRAFQKEDIIALGVTSYQRIIPAVFIPRRNYQVYCVKDSADIDLLRQYAFIYCLEERKPKVAAKVQSTGWLLKNYNFQAFLKSRQEPFKLLFYQTTPPIVDFLDEQKVPWIGNDPSTFEGVLHKEAFRATLKKLKLAHLPDWTLPKEEFFGKTFEELFRRWQKPVVVQPGDYEISGSTMFVHTAEDLEAAKRKFSSGDKFDRVRAIKLSPFILGDALSMLGCVTEAGVLTSTLQLQLIDVPESLHGYPGAGTFFGHDWGCRPWSESSEADAQVIVELIGEWLGKRGYRGIFGIDFIYDNKKDKLYPIECNPRFTGAIPVISMTQLVGGAPPIDFFTLASYLKIPLDFNFDAVNEAWKKKVPAAHVALAPTGIETMSMNIPAGVYRYHEAERAVEYLRPGAFLHELNNNGEFLIIDTVPRQGQKVLQTVPRLFKFVFPVSIAEGSKKIKPLYGEIVDNFAYALRGKKPPERRAEGVKSPDDGGVAVDFNDAEDDLGIE